MLEDIRNLSKYIDIENADKVMKYLSPIPLEIGVDENYINYEAHDHQYR